MVDSALTYFDPSSVQLAGVQYEYNYKQTLYFVHRTQSGTTIFCLVV